MWEGVNEGLGEGVACCFILRRVGVQALEAELAQRLAEMAEKTHDEL